MDTLCIYIVEIISLILLGDRMLKLIQVLIIMPNAQGIIRLYQNKGDTAALQLEVVITSNFLIYYTSKSFHEI